MPKPGRSRVRGFQGVLAQLGHCSPPRARATGSRCHRGVAGTAPWDRFLLSGGSSSSRRRSKKGSNNSKSWSGCSNSRASCLLLHHLLRALPPHLFCGAGVLDGFARVRAAAGGSHPPRQGPGGAGRPQQSVDARRVPTLAPRAEAGCCRRHVGSVALALGPCPSSCCCRASSWCRSRPRSRLNVRWRGHSDVLKALGLTFCWPSAPANVLRIIYFYFISL